MTRKEFEALRLEIEREKFVVRDANPITFAVQRAAFRQAQLRKLISLAGKVKDSRTVAAKVQRWERTISRLQQTSQRFQNTYGSAQASI